jgi:hypothetical protein
MQHKIEELEAQLHRQGPQVELEVSGPLAKSANAVQTHVAVVTPQTASDVNVPPPPLPSLALNAPTAPEEDKGSRALANSIRRTPEEIRAQVK